MNREEILAMEPGRELDYLVMRTIFQARRAYYGEDEVWYRYDENGKPDYEWDAYNSPSTRINAAWEVFEKFDTPFVKKNFDVNDEDYFLCKIGGDIVFGKTAPEAICKAALLAVLEEGETSESNGNG